MSERLTHRDSKGDVWIKDAAHVDEQGQICMLSDRLAQYEDIGLTPDEITDMIYRFEAFLCAMTGGRMSKSNYTLDAMISAANEYQQSLCDECWDRSELAKYYELEHEKRLVVLPPPEESDYEGLKVKYRVYKAKDNTPVENCFVLRPEKDMAAVAALTAYAHATDNKQLAEDILNWITPDERVKVLPCKTEDTVFIVYAKKILETTVDKRAWTDDDGYMLRTKEEWFKEKDIGKTVFLTREEAEKALEAKQRGGKRDE